jgi:hypothetical protein
MIGCVSGSPKRTLNSITFGARRRIDHQARVEEAGERIRRRRSCRATVGLTTSRITRAWTSGVTTGAGE